MAAAQEGEEPREAAPDSNALQMETPHRDPRVRKRIKKNRRFQRNCILREKKRIRKMRKAPMMVISRKHLHRLQLEQN